MSILCGSGQPLRHATTMFANASIGLTCLVSIGSEREVCTFAKKPDLTKPRHTTRRHFGADMRPWNLKNRGAPAEPSIGWGRFAGRPASTVALHQLSI
jgi:hypothetical protein